LRPVAAVAYITGCRTKSELLTRQWRHVDFANGWLRLEPGESKNSDARTFPFTPELRTVLEAQRELVRQIEKAQGVIIPWVFIHPPGTARCEAGSRIKNFRGAWAKACQAASVPGRLVLRPTRRDREMTCRGSMYLIKQKTWSGGSGDAGHGLPAVCDVQLHIGGATGAERSSAAGDSGDDRRGAGILYFFGDLRGLNCGHRRHRTQLLPLPASLTGVAG